MKVSIEKLSDISTTLLLGLHSRALESKRPDAIVRDEMATELIEKIDYDFSGLESHIPTQLATLLRIRECDRLTLMFLQANPDGTVVNLGCGLDTRFYRVDNGALEWYDLDLPEVIEIRRMLLKENQRCHFIDCSVLDFSWMEIVKERYPRSYLFLAEGLLIYFEETEVKSLVIKLTEQFPGSTLVFDAVSPFQAYFSHLHPTFHMMNAPFRWGLADGKDLELWQPGIRLIEEVFYFSCPEPRLGWVNFMLCFPQISRGFSVLKYQLGEENQGHACG